MLTKSAYCLNLRGELHCRKFCNAPSSQPLCIVLEQTGINGALDYSALLTDFSVCASACPKQIKFWFVSPNDGPLFCLLCYDDRNKVLYFFLNITWNYVRFSMVMNRHPSLIERRFLRGSLLWLHHSSIIPPSGLRSNSHTPSRHNILPNIHKICIPSKRLWAIPQFVKACSVEKTGLWFVARRRRIADRLLCRGDLVKWFVILFCKPVILMGCWAKYGWPGR